MCERLKLNRGPQPPRVLGDFISYPDDEPMLNVVMTIEEANALLYHLLRDCPENLTSLATGVRAEYNRAIRERDLSQLYEKKLHDNEQQ